MWSNAWVNLMKMPLCEYKYSMTCLMKCQEKHTWYYWKLFQLKLLKNIYNSSLFLLLLFHPLTIKRWFCIFKELFLFIHRIFFQLFHRKFISCLYELRRSNLILYANLMSCLSSHPSKSLRFSFKHNFLLCKQQLQIDLSYQAGLNACLL